MGKVRQVALPLGFEAFLKVLTYTGEMSAYPPDIRYWSICLVSEDDVAVQKLKDFIVGRADFVTTEKDEVGEMWAVIDVKDHSILTDLAGLDCVALTPAEDAFVMEAWPEMALNQH